MPMGHDPGIERSLTMIDYRTGGTPWMILISPSRQVVFNDFSINADKAIESFAERDCQLVNQLIQALPILKV